MKKLWMLGTSLVVFGILGVACGGGSTTLSPTASRAPVTSPSQSHSTVTPPRTTPPPATVGDTLTGANGASIQVISYGPVAQPEPYGLGKPNDTAIQVKGCAGTVSASFNPLYFTLETADSSRINSDLAGASDQLDSSPVLPGDCTKGEVAFQVPVGQQVAAVLVDNPGVGTGRWKVTAPATPPSATTGASIDTTSVSSNPLSGTVLPTFTSYFGAINSRDFQRAYAVYSPSFQSGTSYQNFASGIATTTDSNIAITGITPNPDGSATVDINFTSHQSANNGPNPGETCTNWSLAYRIVPAALGASPSYLVDSTSPLGAGHTAC